MADTKLTGLTELSVPDLADYAYLVDVSDTTDDAAGSSRKSVLNRLLAVLNPSICQGRLTLESGVAVSTSDQTSKTNVYFTPFNGNRLGVYDGTRWKIYAFSELTLALGTLTSGLNYDVFVYDNAGTLTLEATAWTNDTTRATALTTQDGIYVKNGATTRRYLGTFRTTSTTTTEDSLTKRFLWNLYNQTFRQLLVTEATTSWTYTTATWRSANNSTTNRVEVVCGLATPIEIIVQASALNNDTGGFLKGVSVGVGVDSTSTNSASVYGNQFANNGAQDGGHVIARYHAMASLGYHYYQQLEWSRAVGTTTWYGVVASTSQDQKSGMIGRVLA